MRPFEPKNSFGWTFFVLILASFWNGAAVKFDASPSSASAVASRSVAEDSSSAFDSPVQAFAPENAASSDVLSEPTAALWAASPFDARRLQDSTRRRLGGADFSSLTGSERSAFFRAFSFSAPGLSSAVFRSIWDCQSVSRPLFLTLRSLRN